MPVMDGRRATELIRHWEHQQLTKTRAAAAGPGDPPKGPKHNLLPIIFVTGNVMPGEEALMLSSGATKVRASALILFFLCVRLFARFFASSLLLFPPSFS